MKCRKCNDKAVINMRQHKLALCKPHFLDWIPDQTRRFIEEYHMFQREERILVAVSGGKDSLSLWDVLNRLGYQTDGLYIGLGIDGGTAYSTKSEALCADFAAERGLRLQIVNVQEVEGATIPDAARLTQRGRGKPCSVCGLTKRHVMNRIAREGGYDVIVTGHNLDDEVAVLFGNTLNWMTGYLSRQGPVLHAAEGFARKAKPFFRFYERETAAYALLRGIDYIYEECPHAVGATSIAYKDLLNTLESDRPGAKLSFYLSFLRAKEAGFFTPSQGSPTPQLQLCKACGQPTSAPELCAFCRTWDQIRKRHSVEA